MTPNAYGPMVSPPMVEREIERVLRKWADAYIAEIADHARGDRTALSPIEAWERVGRFPTELPERMLPYVAITSPGTADALMRASDGYSARMLISIGVIAAAGGQDAEQDARDLAADYGFALAAALVHKGITSPLITDVIWRLQNLGERPPIADLSVQASVNTLWVDVDGVLDLYGGPAEPPPDPVPVPPSLGQVEEVELELEVEEPPS